MGKFLKSKDNFKPDGHLKKGHKKQMVNSKAEHIKRTEIGIVTHMFQYTSKEYRVISYSL